MRGPQRDAGVALVGVQARDLQLGVGCRTLLPCLPACPESNSAVFLDPFSLTFLIVILSRRQSEASVCGTVSPRLE